MLRGFTIRNFKSIKSARLDLGSMTLLVGANASGKSNLIEGVAILSWLGRGGQLSYLQNALERGELPVRGRPTDFALDKDQPVTLGCIVDAVPNGTAADIETEVSIRFGLPRTAVVDEVMREPGLGRSDAIYRVERPADEGSHDLIVEYNNFKRGKNPSVTCVDDRPVFAQLDSPARLDDRHEKASENIPRRARHVRDALRNVLILDPAPGRMRDYHHILDKELNPDGSNVSAVLHDLVVVQSQKSAVMEFVRALPEQDIADIDFIRTLRDEVMVRLVESFDGSVRPCDGALLSGGTLRVLAIAAALLSVPEGSLVVIEEVDNGVHPPRVEKLAARIREIALRRDLRVLLTSHNATMLDALPPEGLSDVVLCHRDPHDHSTQLLTLKSLAFYPGIVARGALGQLFTSGAISRYLAVEHANGDEVDRMTDSMMSYFRQ